MRTRMLKPGFFTNEQLASCEPLARILYAGLWCFADRKGCFEWRPLKMKAQIFPLDTCKIEPLLDQLIRQKLVAEYSENGTAYGFIPAFLKHQSPHNKEKDSEIPPPNEEILSLTTKVGRLVYKYNSSFSNNIKNDKQKFGEFENVLLRAEEHEKLVAKLGEEKTARLIENLSEYVSSKGRRYKSHYATILQWSKRDTKTGDSFGI